MCSGKHQKSRIELDTLYSTIMLGLEIEKETKIRFQSQHERQGTDLFFNYFLSTFRFVYQDTIIAWSYQKHDQRSPDVTLHRTAMILTAQEITWIRTETTLQPFFSIIDNLLKCESSADRCWPKDERTLTVNVCKGKPWNASIRYRFVPFVAMEIIFPSGLNFNCVHCSLEVCPLFVDFSWLSEFSNGRNVVKGP